MKTIEVTFISLFLSIIMIMSIALLTELGHLQETILIVLQK